MPGIVARRAARATRTARTCDAPALGEIIARKAGYGGQLTVRSARGSIHATMMAETHPQVAVGCIPATMLVRSHTT